MSHPRATPWLSILWLGLFTGSAAFAAEDLPRYRLEVGQQLSYKQTSEFKYENSRGPGVYTITTDWDVWVVRANKDSSWRIVLHSTRKAFRKVTGTKPYTYSNATSTLGYCDLFPDGRIVNNDSLGYTIHPETLFPRLPADTAALTKGWKGHNPRSDDELAYRPADKAKPRAGEWAFELRRENPTDGIYLITFRATFFFDRTSGQIVRAETSDTQDYVYKGQGTGATKRLAVRKHDAVWLASFAAQTDRYFAASKRYTELTRQAAKTPDECKPLLDRAKTTLEEARAGVTLPVLRAQLDEQIKDHSNTARWTTQDIERRAALVGKPAPTWKLKDLDGKEHSLEDYRGKVVVLDFWYRGCGWCVRAMPQLVELAEDFKDQPVAVLGMNIDEDENNARFVVEKKKLNYPNLKAGGIPKLYQVSGYPTLVLIDPRGNVAEIHFGYTPTLRRDVGASIRRLLGKK
jgi:peroxiredoxin